MIYLANNSRTSTHDDDDIKKKWKELLKNVNMFKSIQKHLWNHLEQIVHTSSWEFHELKYVTVICDDTDDTVNSKSEP